MDVDVTRIGLESDYLIPIGNYIEDDWTVYYFTKTNGSRIPIVRTGIHEDTPLIVTIEHIRPALWNIVFEVIKKDVSSLVKDKHESFKDIRGTFYGQIEVYDINEAIIGRYEIRFSSESGYQLQ